MRRVFFLLLLASCAPLRGRGSDTIRLISKAAPLGEVRYLKSNAVDDYRASNRRYAEAEMTAACDGAFSIDHEWEEQGDVPAVFGAAELWQVVKFRCAATDGGL